MFPFSLKVGLLAYAALPVSTPVAQYHHGHGRPVGNMPGWCFADALGRSKAAYTGHWTITSSGVATVVTVESTISGGIATVVTFQSTTSTIVASTSTTKSSAAPASSTSTTHTTSSSSSIHTTSSSSTHISSTATSSSTSQKSTSTTTGAAVATSTSKHLSPPSPSSDWTEAPNGMHLDGDKCRTGKIGNKVIWNCGDMECDGLWWKCGFSEGPAFYGTESVMTINTTGVAAVTDNNFFLPWTSGGEKPIAPQTTWGMDTSNVAPINATHGVVFAFEIWRGGPNGSYINAGNAVGSITLGPTKPIGTRVGPLLTGPDAIQLGLGGILRVGEYIYTYSLGVPSNVIVGRVRADDSVFSNASHEFLLHNSNSTWISGVLTPLAKNIGATTANKNGQFGCGLYGSVMYNSHLDRYIMLCGAWESWVMMYVSETPWGPWSAEYLLMDYQHDEWVEGSWGPMLRPEYGDGEEVYMSIGPGTKFNVFRIWFGY